MQISQKNSRCLSVIEGEFGLSTPESSKAAHPFFLWNILSSERMSCYSHGMKIHETITFLGSNKIFIIGALLVFALSCYGEGVSTAKTVFSSEQQTLDTKIAPSPSLENRLVNSATCGRSWKKPLAQIHGKIRNVEYRTPPFTGRRGLHLDVEQDNNIQVVVHVYPEMLIARCPAVFQFTVGETVTVEGSEFFTGRGGIQQNICAAKIARKKNVLAIRDPVTGQLERQLCCQAICETNCTGLPPLCDLMCMGNCQKRTLKAVFQGLPFCPSCDKEYATGTSFGP